MNFNATSQMVWDYEENEFRGKKLHLPTIHTKSLYFAFTQD